MNPRKPVTSWTCGGVTSIVASLLLAGPALSAEQRCLVKEVVTDSGDTDSLHLIVSQKAVEGLVARGFSTYQCASPDRAAKRFEKLVCSAAKGKAEPLRRALEAHYKMTVSELCSLTREAIAKD